MKMNFEQQNNQFKELDFKIEVAVKNAIELEEQRKLITEIIQLRKDNNDPVKLTTVLNKLSSCKITVNTLAEFRHVLEKLEFSPEEINEKLSHENAHANTADSLGAKHFGYIFYVFKNEYGDIGVQPAADIYIPKEWSAFRKKNVSDKITKAPKMYGGHLSDSDKNMLKK